MCTRLHENSNKSLLAFLNENAPDYVMVVPEHWLTQAAPRPDVQIYIGISFLLICVPGNISQLLVLLAYYRYSRKIKMCHKYHALVLFRLEITKYISIDLSTIQSP